MICSSVNRDRFIVRLLRWADSTQIWRKFRGSGRVLHRGGGLFETAAQFPSPNYVDFPLNADAQRFFKSGPTFLRRFLPLWVALQVERLWILILPLITLAIPLMRLAPPLYSWQVRRRIYRWYENLRELEMRARHSDDPAERQDVVAGLDKLQNEVGTIEVPLSYTDNLYHLRLHIEFVKRLAIPTHQSPVP